MMRFTGLGWISPIMFILVLVGGGLAGVALAPYGVPVGASVAIAMVVGGTAFGSIARALNSTRTADGRTWHDTHTYFGAPIHKGVGMYWLSAMIAVSIVAGNHTAAWVGWVVFGAALVGALIAYSSYRSRRGLSGVTDRKELAQRRDWFYKDTEMLLPRRWKKVYGGRVVNEIRPFGIVAGELDSIPFTAFDAETGAPEDRQRQTTWVVHLPVAYPRLVMRGGTPQTAEKTRRGEKPEFSETFDTLFGETGTEPPAPQPDAASRAAREAPGGRPRPDADDDFGQAVLTPRVREATVHHGLLDWEIADRDLIFRSTSSETSLPADEVARVAERLVELARLFPADLAERYGTEPTTDIPFEANRTASATG